MSRATALSLSNGQKKFILLLGVPSFGLALAATVTVTYAPLIAKQFTTSTTVVGAVIASEGLVALFLPIIAGAWSDHLQTKIGGRLPFLLTGLPIASIVLLLTGFANSLLALILCILGFFVAYYLAYEPYRAMYPDIIADEAAGRTQSVQAMWRGIGTGVALVVGSFLFAIAKWLPFVTSASVVMASTAIFVYILFKKYGVPTQRHREYESFKDSYVHAIKLLKQKPLRRFVITNTLWELTLAALKSFILLYITVGLGRSKTTAAAVISLAAVIMFIAAPLAGQIGDKYGIARVSRLAAAMFGIFLLVPAFTVNTWLILAAVPLGAFGGAIVLTLPYALMMPMMPNDQHGKLTGIYSTSRGLGIMLGPLLAGITISLTKNALPAHGYSAIWLVCGVAMLLSTVTLRK